MKRPLKREFVGGRESAAYQQAMKEYLEGIGVNMSSQTTNQLVMSLKEEVDTLKQEVATLKSKDFDKGLLKKLIAGLVLSSSPLMKVIRIVDENGVSSELGEAELRDDLHGLLKEMQGETETAA